MKKIYLLFSFLFVTTVNSVFAQIPSCSYDFAWLATGREGIYPDSATNFISGNVGSPYLQNLTIKVPYDTTVPVLGTVQFDHVDLRRNVTNPVNYGLPPGLSIGTTAPNVTITSTDFKFPGNDTSCMVIYGTPTTAGTYNLSFTLRTFVIGSPFAVSTDIVDYYKIVINTPIGLNETANSKFELMNLYPNPSNSNATLRFSSPKSSIVKLNVFNTLGKVIFTKTIDSKQGENEFNLNVKDLPSGIYICSLEYEGKTITKKLIVSKD